MRHALFINPILPQEQLSAMVAKDNLMCRCIYFSKNGYFAPPQYKLPLVLISFVANNLVYEFVII